MEFNDILRNAGEWASGLKLKNADWSPREKSLSIDLYSHAPVEDERRDELLAHLNGRFPFCDVSLNISAPEYSVPVKPEVTPVKREPVKRKKRNKLLFGTRGDDVAATDLGALKTRASGLVIEGVLIAFDIKQLAKKPEKAIMVLSISDYTNTVCAKAFIQVKKQAELEKTLEGIVKERGSLRMYGKCEYDKYSKENVFMMKGAEILPERRRTDTAEDKRVELHLHTKMSSMDALTDVKSAIETAARFGHKAIAITDHGVVQAFPDAYKAGKKNGVKIIYGVEGYLTHDSDPIPMDQDYVVVDIETTGLKPALSEIIEIGAVKISGGEIIDSMGIFVEPTASIPENITQLTGITNKDVKGAPKIEEALKSFIEFSRGCVLVAHNAEFDVGFLRTHSERHGLEFDFRYVDTLTLSRYLFFGVKNHKLDTVCEHLGVSLENHHRALDDATATAQVYLKIMGLLREMGFDTVPANPTDEEKAKKSYHIVILAKTQEGMKNLYRLVSLSHLHFFHKRPRIPKYLMSMFREGLILGSACERGELYQAILHKAPEHEIDDIAKWYDYLEIQPLANNAFMLRDGIVGSEEALQGLNLRIVELGKRFGKPVAATGDVHFLEPEDSVFRAILMTEMKYSDADNQAPLYLKTTDEMLEDFAYLGEDMAYEAVITTPNAIADSCEEIKPYPDGTFAPKIEGAEQALKSTSIERAIALYGKPLPKAVSKRLDKELKSIIDNGFASLYITARQLVQKSLNDGYLVGSRGSVGSSLVATMAGITEVNPLPPHYLCEKCAYSDFEIDKNEYSCGADMPDKNCPKCGAPLRREGFDIPFEVFLGFKGDKTPDIDLNFSGEYQPIAHKYTEEMFGEGHAFRAGTISGIKDKTAYGYVMKYIETTGRQAKKQEIDRLCIGCIGVKRTTGQHPGGIVIVPKENDILEFTPIQYPADDKKKRTVTTHFDFHALDDRLVKLDILGHDDPTALRMLHDITGFDPRSIPLNDPETLALYSSSKGLNIDLTALNGCDVGSLGLPEFGTPFVRQMLKDTRPTTLEELVRIAGLSHGTDVWLNNAQELVLGGIAQLKDVICTRDDIMNSLIARGCDPSASFRIMENVRKGKGITSDMEKRMQDCDTPEWFINSCKKIKYMFPRAHAVAYVLMSFRVAYYKFHYPEAFYAAYFTVRADAFDIKYATGGAQTVLGNIRELQNKGKEATKQENDLVTILEVVYEMNLRGIELSQVDIYRSQAKMFQVEDGRIRPPFSAVAGVGENVAQALADRKQSQRYLSIEDYQQKTKANSAVIAALKEAGCFKGMPERNQLSLF